MTQVLCVIGTRPEAIKMAPVVLELRRQGVPTKVLSTAQHRHLVDQILGVFDIRPDFDMDVMRPNQTLNELAGRILVQVDEILAKEKPRIVIAQGDTTTVMALALACFHRKVPFAHVEAGLRTWDKYSPFPEEMNRVIAGRVAQYHFAPTEGSRQNLLQEGVDDATIWVTGNTVIDALHYAAEKATPPSFLPTDKKLVLVTAHRRENFGEPFRAICLALKELALRHPDIHVVYPVHPNPNVRNVAYELLSDVPGISLVEPLDYVPFVATMKWAHLILTDSGGVQEEAPALGKPVLVLRKETERPEAVEAGVVKLVGPDTQAILAEAEKLLSDLAYYRSMARGVSPYGDGRAAERIVQVLRSA